jgi:hypothetical protein
MRGELLILHPLTSLTEFRSGYEGSEGNIWLGANSTQATQSSYYIGLI